MQLQKLLSLIRQAVDRYNMIAEGDKIAVGVSGGKDSLTLLYALKKLSQFYPKHFTVCAICVDLGYDNTDFTGIDEFCRNLDVPLTLISTQIGKIVMEERKESNPCSLCAKLRKGALVDGLFFWQREHCKSSYESEREGRQSPPELREKKAIL